MKEFVSVRKLKESRNTQTQLTSDSPFFFGNMDVEQDNGNSIKDLLLSREGLVIGFVVVIAAIVIIVNVV